MDYITDAITTDGAIRVLAAETTELCNEAQKMHSLAPTACAALGRILTAASIMGSMLKGKDDSITLQVNGGGPIGRLIAVSDANANVKGYLDNPLLDIERKNGKLDVGSAVGNSGYLTVIRDLGLKEPYIGKVNLVNGEIAQDLCQYFATSEQIPSAVGLGVLVNPDLTVRKAGGFILQLLPGAVEKDIERVESVLKTLPAVTQMLDSGKTPEDMIAMLLDGYDTEIFDTVKTKYECDCSRERTSKALISMGKKELQNIIDEGKDTEVCCHFCNKKYKYSVNDVKDLLNSASK